MLTLAAAVSQDAVAGEALPGVWACLEEASWRLRRAQLVMIAGPPNAGKSLLAFSWVAELNLPSLIFSADTDQFTQALRAAAKVSGLSQKLLERRVEEEGRQVLTGHLQELEDLRFCFESSPSLDDIAMETAAFTEVWGAPPEVIVVDNLMNVIADEENEARGLRTIIAELHDLARQTGACVLLLHHTSEEYDVAVPPPRKAVHGKVSQLPEMILTLANRLTHLGVACVKNRTGGNADASANNVIWLGLDADRMQLTDLKVRTA